MSTTKEKLVSKLGEIEFRESLQRALRQTGRQVDFSEHTTFDEFIRFAGGNGLRVYYDKGSHQYVKNAVTENLVRAIESLLPTNKTP